MGRTATAVTHAEPSRADGQDRSVLAGIRRVVRLVVDFPEAEDARPQLVEQLDDRPRRRLALPRALACRIDQAGPLERDVLGQPGDVPVPLDAARGAFGEALALVLDGLIGGFE